MTIWEFLDKHGFMIVVFFVPILIIFFMGIL
jgi:hypothetical protein